MYLISRTGLCNTLHSSFILTWLLTSLPQIFLVVYFPTLLFCPLFLVLQFSVFLRFYVSAFSSLAEMVRAYTTERRRWLRQTNLRGRRSWTTESRKTEKEMDRRRQVQHGGLRLTVEDTGNHAEWRRRTHVADPSPEGFTAWRRERFSGVAFSVDTYNADLGGVVRGEFDRTQKNRYGRRRWRRDAQREHLQGAVHLPRQDTAVHPPDSCTYRHAIDAAAAAWFVTAI